MSAATITIPADTGNRVLQYALRKARRAAALARGRGWPLEMERFECGIYIGQAIVARYDLRADEDLYQAVANEIGFLLREYLELRP